MTNMENLKKKNESIILFDVFKTLVEFDGDYVNPETFEYLEKWLFFRGVMAAKETLWHFYFNKLQDRLNYSASKHPDVDTLEVWDDILKLFNVPSYQRKLLSIEIALTWRQITTRKIDIYPRTFEMLDACKKAGFRLAIASNTQRAYTEHELDFLGLTEYFDDILFSSDVKLCKPDPEIFHASMRRLNAKPEQIIYVGDNPYDDVIGAHRAGIKTIYLERGTPMREELDEGVKPYATVYNNDVEKVALFAKEYFGITDD